MILWIFLLTFMQSALSLHEPCLDYVQSAMRQKLDLLPLSDKFRSVPTALHENQYDIILRRLNCVFNRTSNQQRTLLTRSRQSGRFYLLDGNDVHRMVFDQHCFRWSYIATIEDRSDGVEEFEIDEIHSAENKTFLIAALYLEDRFQIYQIPDEKLEINNSTIKSIQKIRRAGRTTKTLLLQHSSNVYLITGYMDSDSGKIAVYRWLNYHFSLEDVKDVPRHTELIVHGSKQLVMLVLDFTNHPDRSTNHIYVLNEQRKIVKTQEMYFLFPRMPHYVVDDALYILRCLAIDKCFLYKWNGENLFLRVSKIGLNPKYIELIDNQDSIIALSFKNELFFYRNQPLLKVASAYAVVAEHGHLIANHVYLGPTTKQFYLYKESQNGNLYIFLIGNEYENVLEVFQLKLSKQQRVSPNEGEQENFNALKTSLMNIKTIVNIRKGWIDLMKYQMTKIVRACKSHSRSSLSTNTVFIAESNAVTKMSIEGVSKDHTSQSVLRKWKTLQSMLNQIYARSKDLFYLNRPNAVQTDMKVQGNLHTKNIEMKSITVHPSVSRKRSKRKVQSVRSLTGVTINAKDVIHLGNLFKGLVYKTRINRFPFSLVLKDIHPKKITSKKNTINMIPISSTLYNATENIHKGLKKFRAIDSITGDISHITSKKGHFKLSILRNAVTSAGTNAEIGLSGTREVSHLIVSEHLNNIHLDNFFKHLYYVDAGSVVNGNVYIRGIAQIRNIHGLSLNSIEINKIFNLRTNQTIAASIYMHKVYAKALYCNQINRLSIPKDVILVGNTESIKTALASNFIILHDLTLSNDEQYVNHPVLGTKIEDFSHIYLGNVYLKGTLTIGNMRTNNERTQILIKDQLVNTAVRYHFWMKHLEQDISSFAFHRHVGLPQLLCRTLNYQTVNSYMRAHQWNLRSQKFSKVHVFGRVELFTELLGLVHHIHSEAIPRGTMSTVSGKKIFDGIMHIDFLAAEFVGFTNLHNFATEHASVFMLSEFKQIKRLNVNDCIVSAVKGINIDKYQQNRLSSAIDCSLNIRDVQQVDQLFISDLEVDLMNTTQINGRMSEQFVLEINNITSRVEPSATDLKIKNLISKLNVISTGQVSITNINEVNIADYLRLLALKGPRSMKHREIGGCKMFSQGVTIDENIIAAEINDQSMNHLIGGAARKSIPQNIVGLWFATKTETKYLTTKQINDLPTRHLLNANLRGFKLRQNLILEALTVHANANGHIVPNVSSIAIPTSVQFIDKFAISGSFIIQKHLPKTYLFDVLLASVTNDRSTVEGKIVFHCDSIVMRNIWNDGRIVGQGSNLLQILMDAVTSKQKLLVFNSGARDVSSLVCEQTVVTDAELTVLKINDVDFSQLESTIHSTELHLELIGSVKTFMYPPNIIEFTCPDQLNGIVYPHHLNQIIANQNKIKYQFDKHINVLGNLQVNAVNSYSMQHFMLDIVLKNQTVFNDYVDVSQQVINSITFSAIVLSRSQNALQTINQISINDVTTEVSNEHQMMLESKQIEGQLTLLGPASIMQCNGHNLLDNFKLSFWLRDSKIVHEKVLFSKNEILTGGVFIENALNNVPVATMTKLRLSSVEDLLPLLPRIRGQLVRSSNAVMDANSFGRTPYFEYTPNHNTSKLSHDQATWKDNFKLVVEKGSNVLTIMSREKTANVLYQQILFNEKIDLVEKTSFQGIPAIRIVTDDGMLYLYVHSSLEGWKQFSHGKI